MNRPLPGLLLAVYPSSRGIAFVIFEDRLSPVDWGVKEARGPRKNAACLSAVSDLLERYELGTAILQNSSCRGTFRSLRIRELNSAIADLAGSYGVETTAFSRKEVREVFARVGALTKRDIALAVAKQIPAFERYLPPVRKPWMSEDARMGLFDAAALALTFFQQPSRGAAQTA
jgi:hypothetical protein